jgi:hypothetical protein
MQLMAIPKFIIKIQELRRRHLLLLRQVTQSEKLAELAVLPHQASPEVVPLKVRRLCPGRALQVSTDWNLGRESSGTVCP